MIHFITKHIPLNIKVFLYNKIQKWKLDFLIKNLIFSFLPKPNSYKDIPIIINNYNRLDYLKRLIHSLEIRGYKNIYIIDNQSTYPPLLDYYKNACSYHIFMLDRNVGYKAIWDTGIYEQFKKSYYVYTDSDMCIDDLCPDDFMLHFINILKKHPFAQKVGFGIRIDNLPDCFEFKDKVIKHESQFWENEVSRNIYRAAIDTTFALYRPFCGGAASNEQETYRTGFPYVIKHLPWYINSKHLTEEDIFYFKHIKQSTHWSIQVKNSTYSN